MTFGWLNFTGAGILVLMLVPNMIYAFRTRGAESAEQSRVLDVLEQVGRYGCMLLMVVPLGAPGGKFAFALPADMVAWGVICTALLLAYLLCWIPYSHRPTRPLALILAVVPGVIFLLRGVFLRHWLLCIFAAIFAASHIMITMRNEK